MVAFVATALSRHGRPLSSPQSAEPAQGPILLTQRSALWSPLWLVLALLTMLVGLSLSSIDQQDVDAMVRTWEARVDLMERAQRSGRLSGSDEVAVQRARRDLEQLKRDLAAFRAADTDPLWTMAASIAGSGFVLFCGWLGSSRVEIRPGWVSRRYRLPWLRGWQEPASAYRLRPTPVGTAVLEHPDPRRRLRLIRPRSAGGDWVTRLAVQMGCRVEIRA